MPHPGQLGPDDILTIIRNNMTTISPIVDELYREQGRGIVFINWDELVEHSDEEGIIPLQYFPLDAFEQLEGAGGGRPPFGIKRAVRRYDPDAEIVFWVSGETVKNMVLRVPKKRYSE